jgi:Ras GTPase-activating-like protein IQGAP2/3
MLNQISVGRLFSDDYPYLQPLNQYVTDASAKFSAWIDKGE